MNRQKSNLLSVLAILVLVANQICVAQSPINLSGSIGGGLVLPQSSNLKGGIYSTYDYPLSKTGYDVNGKIRLGLPVLPVTIVGTISYNSLSDNAVIPVTTTSGVVNSEYTYALSIISAGIGVEYTIVPTPILKPYVSAGLAMNFISGSASYENDVIPEAKLNSTSRLGIDLGVGTLIEIPALPFSLDLSAKYRFANVSGMKFDGSGGLNGFGGIPQTSSYNLNDEKNPNDLNDHARSINYFSITLGLNFTIL